jgi:ferredoxin-NADP reductase/MOSC domain-containing protein YiiM/ferredoxin
MAHLVSVNVGLPRDLKWRGETVHTAIWKEAVVGKRWVHRLNIEGDGQGDLAGHGGEHRAVMVYQLESYRYWEHKLGRQDFTFGQFSENFTVEGLPDEEVCIGDRYQIGGALFEVTQPRVTCYRSGIRMNQDDIASLLVSHHRPGFYFRVLAEGEVGAGDEVIKVADGPERLSVSAIDALLYLPGRTQDQLARSLRIPALSPGWRTSFEALLNREVTGASELGNPGLIGDVGPAPAWTGFRVLRVAKVNRESSIVVSLSFETPDGSSLPEALPGQFLALRLRVDTGVAPVIRNYSISSPPGSGIYRVSVKLEPNGLVSSFLHHSVKVGNTIEVSAPRGTFTIKPGNGPVILVSAGIGVTPVLAMLHALASQASTREVWWLYGARSGSDHPFAKEAQEALRKLKGAHSHIAYSKPGLEDQPGRDYDSHGRLSSELLDQLDVPQHGDFYLCGPASFLRDFNEGLRQRGTASAQIHTEIFGPGDSITPGIAPVARSHPHPPTGTLGTGPQTSFARSGLSVPWSPSYRSLLELAEACDVPVRWSCRTGVCHTCETGLIRGAVRYQPEPLEPPAQGNLLLCCAEPVGDVDIDL